MTRNDLLELKKMVEALLRSDGLVEWIGGWVGGRTADGDPFIILYPAADHLREKACRVYPHHFKRLPGFIPTDDVPADTDANPSKGQAKNAGIYHECPRFKIVMRLGKETQMGREKRFHHTLYVPPRQAPAANGAAEQQRLAPQPAGDEADSIKRWWATLDDVEKAVYGEPERFFQLCADAIERYDTHYAARAAWAKLYHKLPTAKNSEAGRQRVIHYRALRAYALNRAAGMNEEKARTGAFSQARAARTPEAG